jgi:protein-arginine kinase activator protein McsA
MIMAVCAKCQRPGRLRSQTLKPATAAQAVTVELCETCAPARSRAAAEAIADAYYDAETGGL